MRKLKLQVQMAVDGYIARPYGEMDWMTFNRDNELKKYVTERTEPNEQYTKSRFTKTLDKSEWGNTVLAKGDLVDEIMKLKKQDGKDIIAYGGATFVSALIKHGLIDEFHYEPEHD